ncbi:MAG: Uncharacterized protein JG781_205 [Peptococcaceae bacterium]|nr:Uncharacterized protein [Peptococcaceae bacterium]
MDKISRAYYEVKYELVFLKMRGNEFQNFFSELMEKRYPGDFQRVRPWGNSGDRKNDGYLASRRILFQVYAPNEMSAAEAIKKIKDDFTSAFPYWEKYFDTWIFVHNSREGLGPDVVETLLSLKVNNSKISVTNWGYEELRRELFLLNDNDIESLLGPAPTDSSLNNLGFEQLQVVLSTISRLPTPNEVDIRPVPQNKIRENMLSDNVQELIKYGMRRANLVEKFFASYYDPIFGDEIASAFHEYYGQLKRQMITPDLIFMKLQEFAGGAKRGTPEHEAAVLAVLAHLFEKCDIFERPRGG